jgi:hypothetical protein
VRTNVDRRKSVQINRFRVRARKNDLALKQPGSGRAALAKTSRRCAS